MYSKSFIINFHSQTTATLANKRKLKQFIAKKLSEFQKTSGEINYIFCSDEYLIEVNKTHLNHDYYTDIITFDLSESGSPILISDIFISTDRVRENASVHHTSFSNELLRVVFHGILHIVGFKDKSQKDAYTMRAMEDAWIAEYLGHE